MLFTSNFRQRKSVRLGMINYDVEAVEADDGFDVPLTNDNPKGWSFTLGKVNSIQLQIYDKLKERLAKGVHTNLDSWVRFEMRYGSIGDRGETVFRLSLLALQNKCFGVLCTQLLRWLIDFKDTDEKFSNRNMDKVPSWKPYDDFLGGVSGNSLPVNQGRAEASVITSVSWIMNQWAKTAVTLCKVSRKYMLSVMANAMCRFINSKQGEGCRNSLNGVVSTFYLMFPDVLGKFDEKKSDEEVKAFIQDFGTGVVDDSEDGSDNGIFSWNKY
jgi:hypothetical protein